MGGLLAIVDYSPDVNVSQVREGSHTSNVTTQSDDSVDFAKLSNEESFINEMVAQLKRRHSHEIKELTVQLMLQDFRDFVLERFPQNGHEIFKKIIGLAFPDNVTGYPLCNRKNGRLRCMVCE